MPAGYGGWAMSTPPPSRELPLSVAVGLGLAVVAILALLAWLVLRDPTAVAPRLQLERVIATDVRSRIGQPVQVSCSGDLPAQKGAGTWCMVRMTNGQLDNVHVPDLDSPGAVTYTAHHVP